MNEVGWQIRAMRQADLSAVVALEQACGLSSWGLEGYEKELANPAALLLAASFRQQFAGYFSGRVLVDEFELFSMAVRPEFRRQGVGGGLLAAGLTTLRERKIKRCFLEVRAANLPAQKMYLAYGFRRLGGRRNYYHDPADDAVTMVWEAVRQKGRAE